MGLLKTSGLKKNEKNSGCIRVFLISFAVVLIVRYGYVVYQIIFLVFGTPFSSFRNETRLTSFLNQVMEDRKIGMLYGMSLNDFIYRMEMDGGLNVFLKPRVYEAIINVIGNGSQNYSIVFRDGVFSDTCFTIKFENGFCATLDVWAESWNQLLINDIRIEEENCQR